MATSKPALAVVEPMAHAFLVEKTAYGWTVFQNGLRRGLFVTLSSAMEDVRARGLVLRRLRDTWAVSVIGSESIGDEKFMLRRRRSGSW